jgi:hypothetical protein
MSQLSALGFTDADLSPRLKFVNVLPSLLLMATVGGLLLSGAPDRAPDFGTMMDNAKDYGWTGAVVSTAGALVAGLLLQPLELASIRMLEGYWSPVGPLGAVGRLGAWIQHRRRSRLRWLRATVGRIDGVLGGHLDRQLNLPR